jgi:hypothetical protein
MTASTLIATRATQDKKARFRALATSRGMDESKLLTLLIDRVLERNAAPARPEVNARADSRTLRVTIRLRVGDGPLLDQRAQARGMKPATYLAALARAHLRGDPSLPMSELAEVKRAVAEISAVGRNLNQIARVANQRGVILDELFNELQAVSAEVERVQVAVAELVRANLISWEAGDG